MDDRTSGAGDLHRRSPAQSRSGLAQSAMVCLVAGLVWCAAAGMPLAAQSQDAAGTTPLTQRWMLSGQGIEDAVGWEFRCTEGRGCGSWTTLPVPSHWEQHGFGNYNYGHDDKPSREEGHYRRRFQVPAQWQGQRVDLVFEGVMTDAVVQVNGQSAGPEHRGAFYAFRYDVSDLLRYGEENLLEVTVRKHSADKKVNRAERDADYWIFGGIFRPVYLEAQHPESIRRWAIDAGHSGDFRADVFLHSWTESGRLRWWIEDDAGSRRGTPQEVQLEAGTTQLRLEGKFPGVAAWSAETPHLHTLHLELGRGDDVLHRTEGTFGFRTFEVRRDEGLFVNGKRILLKGVNRHVFWPSSGRASWPRRDRLDAERIKALNLNAVRTAHYPPDVAFLEACDRLGIYVLNELGGWHDAYGTEHGQQLVEAMVTRDVNHPSILFWNNGNEGGWNEALVPEFGRWDPQQRPVLHPDELLGDVETFHYPNWEEFKELLDADTWRRPRFGWGAMEPPLIMPTELLHGLYDGGSGAGLASYWQRLTDHPLGAGAFLWSFTDESIERRDLDNVLDSDGNHAPDGVLGPYREWSATADAVRHVFSPIAFGETSPTLGEEGIPLTIHNRYDHLDLSSLHFTWQLLQVQVPGASSGPPHSRLLSWGKVQGPEMAPGVSGIWLVPAVGPESVDANLLRLTALDPAGRDVGTWTWPLHGPVDGDLYMGIPAASLDGGLSNTKAWVEGEILQLERVNAKLSIDLGSGELLALGDSDQRLELPGPKLLGRKDGGVETRWRHGPEAAAGTEGAYVVDVMRRRDRLHRLRWAWFDDGWLRLSYLYEHDDRKPFHGVDFGLDLEDLQSLQWLGHGPSRVWANRREGPRLGLWEKERGVQTEAIWGHEPKFLGYYDGVRWARLRLENGDLFIAFEGPGLDLGLGTPRFPEDAEEARADVPSASLSVLGEIPAIGTKFHPADDIEPPLSQPPGRALARGAVWLRWIPRS